MSNPLQPTLGEATEVVRALIHGEVEAGVEGNAYLDDFQLAALRALVSLAYDQLADTDDLIVAKEELETLYDYEQNRGDASTLHGLDTAISVLAKLIANNTSEVSA